MMTLTQVALAVTCTSFMLGSADPKVLGLAALSSLLPDCDNSGSYPGRLLRPLSRYLEERFPHRTITHSFVATLAIGVIGLPLVWVGGWGGWVSGYFWGWFADTFTKSGVTAFWPHRARLVIPGNPKLRLTTGSPAEWWVLGLSLPLLLLSLNLQSQGGLLRTFNLWMGIPNGAVELVNQDQDRYLLTAQIDGIHTLTQQRVQGTFQIVRSLTTTDLLVERGDKLYRAGASIGAQIRIGRIFIRRERPIRSQVETLNWEEALFQLPPDPGQPLHVYYSGVMELDAGDLRILPSLEVFTPITLKKLDANRVLVEMDSARAQDLRPFEGYFGSGQLLIRRLYPQ